MDLNCFGVIFAIFVSCETLSRYNEHKHEFVDDEVNSVSELACRKFFCFVDAEFSLRCGVDSTARFGVVRAALGLSHVSGSLDCGW